MVYNSKHDAMHQGKKIIQNWAKTIISTYFYSTSTYFFIGTIIGTVAKECVEDAISMIKVRNEERLLRSLLTSLVVKKEAEMERERILELLKKFLQNK